jgi:signal transduction histidine kinase/ligand-binding sensor domain-containing protein/DNA-binding response OmpR family regulator
MHMGIFRKSSVAKNILIVPALFCGSFLMAQNRSNFIHLTPKLDNENIRVTHTIQDTLGYIWMTYNRGVAKYGGYNFSFLPYEQLFGVKDLNDGIKEIVKDRLGIIWVLSTNGKLSCQAPNGNFSSFTHKFQGIGGNHKIDYLYAGKESFWLATKEGALFSNNYISSKLDSITTLLTMSSDRESITNIVQTKSSQLLISTTRGFIYSYSPETKKIVDLKVPFDYPQPSDLIMALDKSDKLWIGTTIAQLGLLCYDLKKKKFIHDSIFDIKNRQVIKEIYVSIFCDSDGTLWAGTDGNGLYKIDTHTGGIQIFRHNSSNSFSINSNTIIHINEDAQHNLWVLTNYGDINVLPNGNQHILYHSGTINNSPSRVLSAYKASNGTLWIGTDGNGITKIAPNGLEEGQYLTSTKDGKGFYIQSITEDKNHGIWIGTYKNGLWICNSSTNHFSKVPIENSKGLRAFDVRFLFTDSKERIWAASDLGIYVYKDENTLLAVFENNTHGQSGTICQSIIEDESGTVWVGYEKGGLFKFNEDALDLRKSYFTQYDYGDEQQEKNQEYGILSMAPDLNGAIWIVSVFGHLIKFDIKNNHFKTLKYDDTFNEVTFKSILVEDKNNIWLGSNKGIWHRNQKDSTTKKYYKTDGLQNNLFISRSAHKDKNGYFYFGGLSGVNYFDPKKLVKERVVATLHIEGIEVLNRPAISIIPEQVKQGIPAIKQLHLRHNQSSFSFRFLAIENVLNQNLHYAYRLKGYNNNWIPAELERVATYTNIPSGNYVFQVRAGFEKDQWDIPQKEIAIQIAQPAWNTTWAHILYVVLILFIIYSVVRWIRLNHKFTSEELKHIHEKELYVLKMNFFAKMSHEIQTPLTLILIPIDSMLEKAVESGNELLEQRLTMISNNAKRLSRIVFELTTIRNKELGKLSLRVSENNLIKDLKDLELSFIEYARFKEINFTCYYPYKELMAWYDRDKIEHVFYNLLSNAFKFTPRGGTIAIDAALEEAGDCAKISITNSGPSIEKDELEKIFQLFYQSASGKQNVGMGIGLALTKELVNLHHGSINVNSDPEKGTCFGVCLPIQESAYLPDEKNNAEVPSEDLPRITPFIKRILKKDSNSNLTKTILIVEDNYELQVFLKDIFSDYYQVLLAENGEEGILLAKKHIPDLIISDVLMPKKDGIEMSIALQKDKSTSHIPIILLTAKKTSKNKLLSLRAGALEYIRKPFNVNELMLKVHNIISKSDRLLVKYKMNLLGTPKNIDEKSLDDVFIENIVAQIETHMGNSDFKLEELSEVMHMSYSAFSRKFQAITNKKIVDFVRLMRLKKAFVLLTEYHYSISEAAFSVGFNDVKYFSKCFKKEFGKTPGEFKKQTEKTLV